MKILIITILSLFPFLAFAEKEDYDSLLRQDLHDILDSSFKRVWEIEYKEISPPASSKAWFVKGTNWRVTLYPLVYRMDELDQSKIYQIEAVALEQCYGLVHFYVYGIPKAID